VGAAYDFTILTTVNCGATTTMNVVGLPRLSWRLVHTKPTIQISFP